MKILVIQQKMIGDVLTSSILFEALRQKYPDAQLDYLINEHTYPVVENNPFIDNFIFFTEKEKSNKKALIKLAQSIRKKRYDVVIDAYGKISSYFITKYSKAKIRTGYHKKYSSFIFTHPIKRIKKAIHNASLAIENRFKLLECLGIPFKDISPTIYLTDEERDNAKKYLINSGIDLKKPLFMISVLGSSISKSYPKDYMAHIIDTIGKQPNAQILFNYIPSQKRDVEAVYNLCLPNTKEHIFMNVFGKDLREFLAITSFCSSMIGNEGGAINMAKALGIPTFSLFSPYLNKQNWFGQMESNNHVAVHLSDFIKYNDGDLKRAKHDPESFYRKFKPKYIIPKLIMFITNNQ